MLKQKICVFQRHPRPGFHSIEMVFNTIFRNLSNDFDYHYIISPYPSKGLINRLKSIVFAMKNSGVVNHVVGDEHFLTYALPRGRTVLTIHDCNFITGAKGLRRFILYIFWLYFPLRSSDIITTISNHSKNQIVLLTGYNAERIRVIENPVSEIFVRKEVKNNLRPNILHIGTKSNKNLHRLIEAIADLALDLTIIGRLSDVYLMALSKHNISYVNIFDVSSEDLVSAYNNCTIVAFVSTAEGFGMPIIEAQSVGRPILTSNISPLVEVAGRGALFVDPFSVSEIRYGIEKLISDADLCTSLVSAGFENVQRYSAKNIAKRYEEVYRDLLND